MAVYTRYARVLDAAGKLLTVREALVLINQTLDEVLTEQEGDFDADSRWALAWFEQFGFADGELRRGRDALEGQETRASQGMVEAGILKSKGGKVRLLRPDELPLGLGPGNRPTSDGLGVGSPTGAHAGGRWREPCGRACDKAG